MELAGGISQEDLKLFLQEADEQIQLLDEDIVKLEKQNNSDLMQEIFRAAHTLKGSSAMVGHERMSELAHAMENVLDNLRKGTLAVVPSVIDALLHGLDMMRLLREELVDPNAPETDISEVTRELASSMETGKQGESQHDNEAGVLPCDGETRLKLERAKNNGKIAYRVKVQINKKSSWVSVRCFQIIKELEAILEIIDSSPTQQEIENEKGGFTIQTWVAGTVSEDEIKQCLGTINEIDSIEISEYGTEAPASDKKKPSVSDTAEIKKPDTAEVKKPGAAEVKKEDSKLGQTVRVDVSRLDTLMEQVGELVINRNQVSQIGRMLGGKYKDDELVHSLSDCVTQIAKIVGTLQQDVMAIRMLPIEIVFNTLPRMVRDIARQMNKKIDFIIEGQETEVDRSVIEHLRDPLIHLLRNAIDHGVESPEERISAGKPETGIVKLSAYNEQDNILITLKDDGKGIVPEVLRQSAIKKGILSAEEAAKLTDSEAIDMIFSSGFSTAKKITEVSGRGVGLDVVKTNIEALNGSVSVESTEGQGTTFTLTLPLTLAIIPALLVTIQKTICAVPLSSIDETVKLMKKDIKTIGNREATIFRGNVLPLLRLDEVFGWETERKENEESVYVVVVKFSGTQVGIIVDALLEQQELVVKSLDKSIGGSNGVTGASILGDGKVVLILDVASLVRNSIMERRNEKNKTESHLAASYSAK